MANRSLEKNVEKIKRRCLLNYAKTVLCTPLAIFLCSQKGPQDVNAHLLTTSVPSIVKVSMVITDL